jgi:hypothetical protein
VLAAKDFYKTIGGTESVPSLETLMKISMCSRTTVTDANKIDREGAPELCKKVRSGAVSMERALALPIVIRKRKFRQRRALETFKGAMVRRAIAARAAGAKVPATEA